jgi:hypothetical protein
VYIQVITGWRYRPGMRARTYAQVERLRAPDGSTYRLMPDAPGLVARLWGTDPDDEDTGVAIWVWESKEAADAFTFPWDEERRAPTPLDNRMDFSGVRVRELDGMYLALSPGLLDRLKEVM